MLGEHFEEDRICGEDVIVREVVVKVP